MHNIFFATAIIIISATCATASGGKTEILEKWAGQIVAIKKGVCASDPKKTRKLLDYAAVLIIHNETGEAKEILSNAMRWAESDKCRGAIKNQVRAR